MTRDDHRRPQRQTLYLCASNNSPQKSTPSPRRSTLGDKLQKLAQVSPSHVMALELIVDRILAHLHLGPLGIVSLLCDLYLQS
jgi:hypothetical protein